MRHFLYNLITILFLMVSVGSYACSEPVSVCASPSSASFSLINNSVPSSVIVDGEADPAVTEAAANFAADLQRVSGSSANLLNKIQKLNNAVIIGQLGQSKIIDDLVNANKIDVSAIVGKWEAYQISVVNNPLPKLKQALVIVGSDRRGAVFGTYDLSEKIGVSPWYWFADVPVKRKSNLYVSAGQRVDQPKVRYRGIFINDEDPALGSWARKKFSGVNSKMYKHVFELILRLKANYIWPAMWGKAIHFDDPRSTTVADNMGIVVGTSHHEPMTLAHVEWHKYPDDPTTGGKWDYATNAENLRSFWRKGIERMMSKGDGKGYDSLITVGMRGDGDEPMSEETATKLLETVVADQRKIIAEVTGKPAEQTPQVWALYKEVQDYYDQGMMVPDDVTLLFADDNWGQIRRLPTKDLDRKGGFGVYYHFDYVGAPRNYKWINTTQINKVWQQMDLAYQRGAKNIWIVNVGDIKPMEYPIDFFLEMAWDPEAMDLDTVNAYPQKWATETFGAENATAIAQLMTDYSRYASRRKPELINEETYPIGEIKDDLLTRGEMGEYVELWRTLVGQVEATKKHINKTQQDAYYQLVEFPIRALANLYEMYHAAAWNRKLVEHNDPRANYFYNETERTFAEDAQLTAQYHSINGGKWDGMMSQVHMNYVSWNDPAEQTIPTVKLINNPDTNPVEIKFVASKQVDDNILNVDASDYTRNIAGEEIQWAKVDDLGQSNAAMISYPQGKASVSLDKAPSLEYDFSTTDKQNLVAKLLLGPTLDTIGQGGVKIGVGIDDNPVQMVNLNLQPTCCAANTPEKKAWYQAVKDHGYKLTAAFDNVAAGKHTLKIFRIDDNIILEKVTIKSR